MLNLNDKKKVGIIVDNQRKWKMIPQYFCKIFSCNFERVKNNKYDTMRSGELKKLM